MHHAPVLLVAAIILAVFLAGCTAPQSTEEPSLPSTTPPEVPSPVPSIYWTWTLSTANTGGKTASILPQTTITATFSDTGLVSGFAGCSNYTATCQVTGTNLAVGTPASGKVECRSPTGVMDQQAIYLANLQGAETYIIDGERLILSDLQKNILLVYDRGGAERNTLPIGGIPWHLDRYRLESGSPMPVIMDTTITALFGPDTTLSGSSGCNAYTGRFTTDGWNGLAIGPLGSTRMYCGDPGVMDQESAYLSLLQSVSSYELTGEGSLHLKNASGTLVLVYSS